MSYFIPDVFQEDINGYEGVAMDSTELIRWGEDNLSVPLQMLVAAIPVIGGPASVGIAAIHQGIRSKRTRKFFESLKKGEQQITKELVESEEFLFAFFAVHDAIQRAIRDDKISYFANLLLNGAAVHDGTISDFESLLSDLIALNEDDLKVVHLLTTEQKEGTPYRRKALRILDDAGYERRDSLTVIGRLYARGLLVLDLERVGLHGSSGNLEWTLNPRIYRLVDMIKERAFPNS